MTVPEPMTRTELMELAALDALGLLDEYEAALYTRSFHDAPAPVQDEIRELQAKIAVQLSEFCEEEPSSELRDRVLKAVSKAIELDSPAPLASIGRAYDEYDPRSQSTDHEADRNRRGSYAFTSRRLTLSGQFWRAACFVLLGVVVVSAFGMTKVWQSHNELSMAAFQSLTSEQIERQIGPTVKEFLRSQETIRVVMSASDNACEVCWGTVMLLEESDHALLITEGLPELAEGQTYELRVRHENGQTMTLDRIDAGMMLHGHQVKIDSTIAFANATWELAGPNGVVISGTRT